MMNERLMVLQPIGWIKSKKVSKVLSRASRAHGAALISVSLALSRTPAEAARPRMRG